MDMCINMYLDMCVDLCIYMFMDISETHVP